MLTITHTVLIVDDEPLIRMSAVDTVRDAGFDAVSASGSEQALRILEENRDISLLFTDIRMAGPSDGLELAKTVRERWPEVSVIVTSGHLNSVDQEDGIHFLAKPYSPDELTRALNKFG